MESTGVYWIPLFQILEKRNVEVRLVNASHVKNVPGWKTDVADCQWIQHLHACGLLRGSFRPSDKICAIRSLWRHRDNLIGLATIHLQHMQKALDQMNVQRHHVISDLAGTAGLAIFDAILAGERNPAKLAQLRDWRIRAPEKTIILKRQLAHCKWPDFPLKRAAPAAEFVEDLPQHRGPALRRF